MKTNIYQISLSNCHKKQCAPCDFTHGAHPEIPYRLDISISATSCLHRFHLLFLQDCSTGELAVVEIGVKAILR
jgi:hypothetical protein